MKHFIYLILFLLFTFHVSSAQPGIVQGWVKDEKGNPLAGASVTILESHRGTVTNHKGHFAFKATPGTYTILASFVGHLAVEEKIAIRAGRTVEQNFVTERVYKQCQEVVISWSPSKQNLKNRGTNNQKDSVAINRDMRFLLISILN